eukprot:m.334288 g.334288  ORF g.334288 m.334288 type:complete len:750 (-) comp17328_c0_seq1:1265-3514(-)
MATKLKAAKCLSEAYALRNLITVSAENFKAGSLIYLKIRNTAGEQFFFSGQVDDKTKPNEIGLSGPQRTYTKIVPGDVVTVEQTQFSPSEYLGGLEISLDFFKKKQSGASRYDTKAMSKFVIETFTKQVFTNSMDFLMDFPHESGVVRFKATVSHMIGLEMGGKPAKALAAGILTEQTKVTFAVKEGSLVCLAGHNVKGGSQQKSLFDAGWKFEDMGIGGLGAQFQEMFRRAFVSRIFPPEVVEKLGIQHTKGIMLFGPPGTGKTLMARQIGKMLNGQEPKVVNGPEIMSKYVGESEENVRKLFEDAEREQNERGENSRLHIIIFDEIDAICKERGSTSGGTGVADSVVNQLLSKIDGVEALNNVLLIGMTNRLDMIDEALLRPGRFELKLQIGLPDEAGRVEIFKIHTKKLTDNNYLGTVNLQELAAKAKNFSGAEIAGLIRAAVSHATSRCMKTDNPTEADMDKINNLKVEAGDFESAFNEVRPAFGAQEDFGEMTKNSIVEWDLNIDVILRTGELLVQQASKSERTPLVSMMLSGPSGAGKTALAVKIAHDSGFPFIKMLSPEKMVGLTVGHRVSKMKKVFEDAYKSVRSVVVIDDIERLIDFVEIGMRFSNDLLQALLVLVKKTPPPGHRMLIVATTSNYEILHKMGLVQEFSKVQHVNYVERGEQVMKILTELKCFDDSTLSSIQKSVTDRNIKHEAFGDIPISVGVKKVGVLAEMAKQADDIADTFIDALYSECKANNSALDL